MKKGLLIVVSGPSGAGKGVTCKRLKELAPDIQVSVSCTTRAPRQGEIDGQAYFFLTEAEFNQKIEAGGFLEHASYLNHQYGTPKDYVFDMLEQGKDVILEIEVQGALMVNAHYPEAVLMFVLPPSLAVLEQRLVARGTETEEQTKRRLEIAKKEIELLNDYDYVIKNDKIDNAAKQMLTIISAEKCAVKRNIELSSRLLQGENIL
ncbi:MAG: guanylate kinase [Eubacteriales bacterium]